MSNTNNTQHTLTSQDTYESPRKSCSLIRPKVDSASKLGKTSPNSILQLLSVSLCLCCMLGSVVWCVIFSTRIVGKPHDIVTVAPPTEDRCSLF